MTKPTSNLVLSELTMQRIHEGLLSKMPAKSVRNVRATRVPFPIPEPKISMRLQSRGNTMNIVIPVRGLLRAPIGLEPMADMPKWP